MNMCMRKRERCSFLLENLLSLEIERFCDKFGNPYCHTGWEHVNFFCNVCKILNGKKRSFNLKPENENRPINSWFMTKR